MYKFYYRDQLHNFNAEYINLRYISKTNFKNYTFTNVYLRIYDL